MNNDLSKKALLPLKTIVSMVYGEAKKPSAVTLQSWITDGINGLRLPVADMGKPSYHRYVISLEAFMGWLDDVSFEAGVIANAPRKAAEPKQTDLRDQAEAAMRRIQNL